MEYLEELMYFYDESCGILGQYRTRFKSKTTIVDRNSFGMSLYFQKRIYFNFSVER